MRKVVLTRITLFDFYFGRIDFYQAFQGYYENKAFDDVVDREIKIREIIKERYPFIDREGKMETEGVNAVVFIPRDLFRFTKQQSQRIKKIHKHQN